MGRLHLLVSLNGLLALTSIVVIKTEVQQFCLHPLGRLLWSESRYDSSLNIGI